jgi:hypothetical protein
VPAREIREPADERPELGGHVAGHDLALRPPDDLLGRLRLADERLVGRGQALRPARVDQEADEQVRHLVAGGPIDRPVGQRLVGAEDLLDEEVGRPADPAAEPVEVGTGVAQAVDVVDAEPVDGAVGDQREDELVGRLEDRLVLDPEPGEVADREEAPVVQRLRRQAEPRRPPVLRGDERFEGRPGRAVARRPPEPLDRRRGRLRARDPCAQLPPGPVVGLRRQRFRIGCERVEPRRAQDRRVGRRRQRQLVRAVGPDREASRLGVEAQLERALGERDAVGLAEHRDQHLPGEARRG